jgi:hypothetical protein
MHWAMQMPFAPAAVREEIAQMASEKGAASERSSA